MTKENCLFSSYIPTKTKVALHVILVNISYYCSDSFRTVSNFIKCTPSEAEAIRHAEPVLINTVIMKIKMWCLDPEQSLEQFVVTPSYSV